MRIAAKWPVWATALAPLLGSVVARAEVEATPPSNEEKAPPEPPGARPSTEGGSPSQPSAASAPEVLVRGTGWPSPRGIGDIRVQRAEIDASPRQQTSEMLSAAPGFFVDHEDGEGLANDVYLRGFDLEHGSGIEMRVGSVPINVPLHIQGQGYADANFIIPEVVRSIRVLEGPFDPRQGDAAIVGSAYFDIGVPRRGYRAGLSYGSFDQMRLVGIAAPADADRDTFAAVALRKTDGFGMRREGRSASANAQFAVDLGARDRLRLLATAYAAESSRAGVVRQGDVEAGRIGLYDAYPFFAEGQGVGSSRAILGVTYEHAGPGAMRVEVAPWFMWTDFRARQNYAGALETAQIDPKRAALGDLFETTNREAATGVTARVRSGTLRPGDDIEMVLEPGIYARAARTRQTKSLLVPTTLLAWDSRIDARVDSVDLGAYVDLDVRMWRRLRLSGGPRADLLGVTVHDHLARAVPAIDGTASTAERDAVGVAPGLRATLEYQLSPWMMPAVSFGRGFRSLAAERIGRGSSEPYSAVTSVEGGIRWSIAKDRYVARLSLFETRIANELVFEANSGGLETQNSSVRRGMVGSMVIKPFPWLLASTSLSLTRAVYATRVPGVSHHVPNIPSVLFRVDATARTRLATWRDTPLHGRLGAGYTLLGGRHLTDAIIGPAYHVLNVAAAVRYDTVELGVDVYNALDSRNPDDEQVYVSNWSLLPGQQPASMATHWTAAPPRTVIGTVSVYF